MPSGVFQIQATAGSGKTQLALTLLASAREGQKCLYICFNRPLADRVIKMAPPQARVQTFHEYCVERYRRTHGEPDFAREGMMDEVVTAYLENLEKDQNLFDLIVIDEGQDLEPEWASAIITRVSDTGRVYLLVDEDQSIYERDQYEIPDAAKVESYDNFRSPVCIVELINSLKLTRKPVSAKNPYRGDAPEIFTYDVDSKDLIRKTASAVKQMIDRGFQSSDIAVLSWKGRANSQVLGLRELADLPTSQFSGEFDQAGDPVWTEGCLMLETINRFKGQCAPAIVLTEVDFDILGDKQKAKLLVGLTRARLAVSLVVSVGAEQVILGEFSA